MLKGFIGIIKMRCKNPDCSKVHKHSQKGFTWTLFQLCPTCFKEITRQIPTTHKKNKWIIA